VLRPLPLASVSLALLFASPSAQAQLSPQTHHLRWDPGLDIAFTAGGAALWVAGELLKNQLAPAECRWCETNPLDDGVRTALLWRDTHSAALLSDVTGFVLVPLAALGLDAVAAAHEDANGYVAEDALLITEAGVLAADLNSITKLLVGRERPFARARYLKEGKATFHGSDDDLSFYSGHTTETFALATAAGTIGELRGYRWAPVPLAVGGAFAFATAYLRVAADRHWLTDTLVGAAIGIGVGFLVPYLFHPRFDEPTAAQTPSFARPYLTPPAAHVPSISFAW